MDADLKATLLTRHTPTDTVPLTVEIDGVVSVHEVRVRGLSRAEVRDIGLRETLTNAAAELFYLSRGLDMTEEEAATLSDSGGLKEIELLIDKILQLSGLAEGAAKSDVPSV